MEIKFIELHTADGNSVISVNVNYIIYVAPIEKDDPIKGDHPNAESAIKLEDYKWVYLRETYEKVLNKINDIKRLI